MSHVETVSASRRNDKDIYLWCVFFGKTWLYHISKWMQCYIRGPIFSLSLPLQTWTTHWLSQTTLGFIRREGKETHKLLQDCVHNWWGGGDGELRFHGRASGSAGIELQISPGLHWRCYPGHILERHIHSYIYIYRAQRSEAVSPCTDPPVTNCNAK